MIHSNLAKKLCLLMLSAFLLIASFIGFANRNIVYADSSSTDINLPTKEEVDKYTDSDYLFNSVDSTTSTINKIQDYKEKLWGVKVGKDDVITQIVPRSYFYNVIAETVVGKEYGFYIKTESAQLYDEKNGHEHGGYASNVFVFDVSIVANTTGNEFSYTLTPLYVFNYYSDNNGVRPQTANKPDLSDKYYLNNVSFGYTVFNENSYNSQDRYGYTKENDKGPVILQTRYNSNGYKGAKWQGDAESIYIAVKRIAGTLLKDVLKNTPYIKEAISIIDLCLDLKDMSKLAIWEQTPVTNNNEINIITYKDKNAYAEDELYLRSSVIIANDDIVYKSGSNHYAQGILLLGSIEEAYRIYEDIKLNIATVDTQGNVTVVSSGERQEYSIHNDSHRDEIQAENSQLVYTLPYGEKRFTFTPRYSGSYEITHSTTGNYTYYLYKANGSRTEITNINDIVLTKGTTYNLDIVNNDDSIYADTFCLSLKSIEKNSDVHVSVGAKETTALKYTCTENEILDIKSSDSNIKILNIVNINNPADSMLNLNRQSVSKKFYSGNTYVIEFSNDTDTVHTADISLDDVSALPSVSDPSDIESFYIFTATEQANYIISFAYKNSDIGVEILSDNLEAKQFEQGFGPGYKTVNVSMLSGEKIYVGIYDSSSTNEVIDITYSQEKDSYKWKINGKLIDGNSIELPQGSAASLELVINNSVSVKTFQIDNADYKFTTINNTITLDEECRISNYFEVKAVLESTNADGAINDTSGRRFYGKSLYITPVLDDTYEIVAFSDQNGFGISWANENILEVQYKITAGSNTKVITGNDGNIMPQIKAWNYQSATDVSVEIISIKVQGKSQSSTVEDWVNNGTKGIDYPIKYVNALFGGGDGSNKSPYIISCVRHLINIDYTKQVDEESGGYIVGSFLLTNDLSLAGITWKPLADITQGFCGDFNGDGHSISNLYISETNPTMSHYYFGLFASVSGTVRNLKLYNVSITVKNPNKGFQAEAGAVCGYNKGEISNVTTTGSINATNDGMNKSKNYSTIGGIAGTENETGKIINCTSFVYLTGGNVIGGIVGIDHGLIQHCTYSGNIYYDSIYENHDCIGGIAGIVRKDDYDCNGRMDDITVTGQIYINVTAKSNKSLQPYIGGIIGKCEGGEHTNWSVGEDVFVNASNLGVVKIESGLNIAEYAVNHAQYIHRYVGYGDCVIK